MFQSGSRPLEANSWPADNHDIISMKLFQLMVEHTPDEESIELDQDRAQRQLPPSQPKGMHVQPPGGPGWLRKLLKVHLLFPGPTQPLNQQLVLMNRCVSPWPLYRLALSAGVTASEAIGAICCSRRGMVPQCVASANSLQ